jgi:hypothetical protein
MKRMLILLALMSGFGIAMPVTAVASHTIVGPIADDSATSLSVQGQATATGAPAPTASKAKSSDLLTSQQVKALIASAHTPADHTKLQKHYLALAAKYEADAVDHAAEADAYRKNSTFMESKHPADPGTATHCDRFAQLAREAAREARDLASAHEHMAAAK